MHDWVKFEKKEGILTEYISTDLPDSVKIDGIVIVMKHTFDGTAKDGGEAHDFPELLFIERGTHRPIVNGAEFLLKSGQMILYPPNAYHTARDYSGASAVILSFRADPAPLTQLFNRVISLTQPQTQTLLQIVADGISNFTKCGPTQKKQGKKGMVLKDSSDPHTLQRMKKQLEFFLTDLCAGQKNVPDKREREFLTVVNFLTERIDQPLSLKEISEGCGMSVSKLKLLFRERCGGGVIDYFLKLKTEEAKKRIREGKQNFSQIAETLGFSSLHYFSRTFKRISGQSPSQFEKTE